MWLFLISLFLVLFTVLVWWPIHGYLLFFLLLFYALWYFDGNERTGHRVWNAFRSFSFWNKLNPTTLCMCDATELEQPKKRLLIMAPAPQTLCPMIWGFGLHGGFIKPEARLCMLLPRALFYFPLLRDVLLWCGAIAEDNSERVHDQLEDLLRQNRSVCWAPSRGSLSSADFWLWQFARDQNVALIPVSVAGEARRYHIYRVWPWLANQAEERIGYPLTQFTFPRVFGSSPPAFVTVAVGFSLCSADYTSNHELQQTFLRRLRGLVETSIHGELNVEEM
jgi:hypothetical protein